MAWLSLPPDTFSATSAPRRIMSRHWVGTGMSNGRRRFPVMLVVMAAAPPVIVLPGEGAAASPGPHAPHVEGAELVLLVGGVRGGGDGDDGDGVTAIVVGAAAEFRLSGYRNRRCRVILAVQAAGVGMGCGDDEELAGGGRRLRGRDGAAAATERRDHRAGQGRSFAARARFRGARG